MKNYFFLALLVSIATFTMAGCAGPGSYGLVSSDMAVTPLQLAAGQPDKSNGYKPLQDLKKVKELVEGGADVNKINMFGSALHSAARYGTPEIVSYLIAHGAEVNIKANMGETPLLAAANTGKFEIVKLLIEKGADVKAENTTLKWNAVVYAAMAGNYGMITYLVDHGADLQNYADAAYVNAATGMALFMKSENEVKGNFKNQKRTYEFVAILELMKTKGANVNSVDKLGQTALHKVAIYGNPQVTRYFLKNGANPNIVDKIGNTPLAATIPTRDAQFKNSQSTTNPLPSLWSEKTWELVKKNAKDSLAGYDETIEILKQATNSNSQPIRLASSSISSTINSSTKSSNNSSRAEPSPSNGLMDQAKDTLAGCIKLKASQKLCDQLPWPASTGCNAMAKSQFSNLVCQ